MKKITLLFVLLFGFTATLNAQFFKKLSKKVEKAAEKAVEKKAEQKTTKETEKAFDSTFNKKRKKRKNTTTPRLSKAEPALSYAFNHRAEMQFKNGKELMNIDYFFPESGNYMAMLIKDKRIKDKFLSVYDIDREAMFTYMDNNGQKIKMGIAFETESAVDEALNESSIKITSTGKSKTILGYLCQEYKMTGKDMTATIWVTKEVAIRFPSTFYSIKQDKKSIGQNQAWMKEFEGWAMEMVMVDTSKKKAQTITMNCLAIEESTLNINSNEYQNLGY